MNEGTGASAAERPPVLDEIHAWRRHGEELRVRLLEERDALCSRLKEVEAALALIAPLASEPRRSASPLPPAPPVATMVATAHDGRMDERDPAFSMRKLRGTSMPQMVRRIVQAHPAGISAKDVVNLVREIMPKVDPALVHSGLYRGIEGGDIRSEGTRGSRLYFPAGINHVAAITRPQEHVSVTEATE